MYLLFNVYIVFSVLGKNVFFLSLYKHVLASLLTCQVNLLQETFLCDVSEMFFSERFFSVTRTFSVLSLFHHDNV